MNIQEIFNKSVTHLNKQGKRAASYDENGEYEGCKYRTDDGLSCAIGCLLDDEMAKRLDGLSKIGVNVGSLIRYHDNLPKWMNKDNKDFLMKLQDCHDTASKDFLTEFNSNAVKLGNYYGLNIDVIPVEYRE